MDRRLMLQMLGEARTTIRECISMIEDVKKQIKDDEPERATYLGFVVDDLQGSVLENLEAAIEGNGENAFRSVRED